MKFSFCWYNLNPRQHSDVDTDAWNMCYALHFIVFKSNLPTDGGHSCVLIQI